MLAHGFRPEAFISKGTYTEAAPLSLANFIVLCSVTMVAYNRAEWRRSL